MSAGRTTGARTSIAPSSTNGARADHLDADALLVALTLSPATYSRNRFFEMYRSPDMQRTRRRAGQLRGVVAALATPSTKEGAGRVTSIDADETGGATVTYEVASLNLRRAVTLRSLEMALLRYCVARARGDEAPTELTPSTSDRERIGAALQRLSPLARSAASTPPSHAPSDIRAEE